jgi:hypothetical protein
LKYNGLLRGVKGTASGPDLTATFLAVNINQLSFHFTLLQTLANKPDLIPLSYHIRYQCSLAIPSQKGKKDG